MEEAASDALEVERVRERLDEGRSPLHARASDPGRVGVAEVGIELGRAHAELLDALLQEMFAAAADPGPGVSLAGVGSYGRGAVALGADLDVRLLTTDLDLAEPLAEMLLYPMWDAGLSVGHQVVTPGELLDAATEDLPTATSLLDWRFVAGDRGLSDQLVEDARRRLFSTTNLAGFLDRLEADVERRHARYGSSVYLLEPDVKNGPGGLRDLDVAWWAARARWRVPGFDGLVRVGALMGRQLDAVRRARDRLWRVRNLLHDRAGRRNDRLSFGEQEALAPLLGYPRDDGNLGHAVERMMSDYYRSARTVSRFRDLVMTRARPVVRRKRPASKPLGGGVLSFGDEITLDDLTTVERDPVVVFRAFEHAVQQGAPLRATLRNAIIAAAGDLSWCAKLREAPDAGRLFVKLVTSCVPTAFKAGTVMRELHDVGLLLAMVPEFAPVVGRVHHDTYHVYTVDVHSVAAVDRLGEIVRGDIVLDEEEGDRWAGALACRLGHEVERPWVLFFATLLHDVGKAIGSRGHSERGADMCRVILERLRSVGAPFTDEDVDAVAQLIRHHLTMYQTATRRDVEDPATLAEFEEVVVDATSLRNLYLLTVADLSTTSPTSMTSWKARMLDDLYLAERRYLRSGEDASHEVRAARLQGAVAQVQAASDGLLEEGTLRSFVAGMPDRYARNHGAHAIAAHAAVVARHLAGSAVATVALVPPPGANETGLAGPAVLCVVADDHPGSLFHISAALAHCRLQVHSAQIYSCRFDGERRLALDLFWVERAGGDEVAPLVGKLERAITEIHGGESSAESVARARPPREHVPRIPTRVLVDTRAVPDHTVVEIFTRDRPGLLFTLARAIYHSGLSIALAKIATEGSRVVDVFYVTDHDGRKVTDPERVDALRRTLLAHLGSDSP